MKKDSVIIVTGGQGYLGGVIADRLKKAGCRPVVFDLHSEHPVDITDYDAVSREVAKVHEEYGRLDGLVNCAGGSSRKESRPFAVQKPEVLRAILEMNLFGTFWCTRAVAPYLLEQKSGVIVNISSMVALGGMVGNSDYGAAKAGIIAATKAWAMEFGPSNVRVNCVCPGKVQRPDAMPADPAAFAHRHSYLTRLCTAEDVANLVEFLLDDEKSGFITGQNYVIDGGRGLGLRGDNL